MRLGIIGGTFDPIHLGHLAIAQDAADELILPRILFVPAARPPHKQGRLVTDVTHRIAMVRLAIADNPLFQLSTIELDREGLSYTVDTLVQLKHTYGAAVALFYIVGGDAPRELLSWRDPERILALATLVVVARPGYMDEHIQKLQGTLPVAKTRIRVLDGPRCDLSATDIRARVEKGRSVRYLVHQDVQAYIARHRLYHGNQ